jgi:hypothetical protein
MSPGRGLPDSSTGRVEKGIRKLAVGHVAIWTLGADVPIELRYLPKRNAGGRFNCSLANYLA